MKYILDPKWKLRNEEEFILLYGVDKYINNLSRYALHPLSAIVLSLFNGENDIADIIETFEYIVGCSNFRAQKYVKEVYNQFKDMLVDVKTIDEKYIIRYDPKEFIISNDKFKVNQYKKLKAPLFYALALTYKCCTNCIYCYADRRKINEDKYMNKKDIMELIDYSGKNRVAYITLTGGDPMQHKDIIEIVSHIRKNNIYPLITTKSYISKEIAMKLKVAGLTTIQLSLDSVNNEIANELVKVKNYGDRTLESIKNLNEAAIPVQVNCVVNQINANYIEDLIYKLSQYDIDIIRLSPYSQGIHTNYDDLLLTDEQTKLIENVIQRYRKNCNKIRIEFYKKSLQYLEKNKNFEEKLSSYKNRSFCSGGRQAVYITPDGYVTICEQLPINEQFIVGNLKEKSLEEIWKSSEMLEQIYPDKEKFVGTNCFNCSDFKECHESKGRCIREAYHINKNKYSPAPNCPYA